MSDFIVLLKQVPDVTRIDDNCFNPETGTLIRAKLPPVLNDLDAQALSLAAKMRSLQGGTGVMVLLTMGPPMADDVLRYGLKRGADAAVLLTDKAFGGADTVATANPLAGAIRRIARDYFDNRTDYYVVCGMQSVDGDTAQVPPQIAEELKAACITYVNDVAGGRNGFEFRRILTGGSQTVAPQQLPAVVTVAKYDEPLFPSFFHSRKAAQFSVVKWGMKDIDAAITGLDGSKTCVSRIFQPEKSDRKCEQLHSARAMAEKIAESFRSSAIARAEDGPVAATVPYLLPARRKNLWDRPFEAAPRDGETFHLIASLLRETGLPTDRELSQSEKNTVLAKAGKKLTKNMLDDFLAGVRLQEPTFPGEVWVMAEHSGGVPSNATLELLGKARELADALETRVGAVIAGSDTRPMAPALFAHGTDKVYHLDHVLLETFDPLPLRKVVADVVLRYRPSIFLFSATPEGRTLAPLVAYRTGNGLTADCTGLAIKDMTVKNKIALLFQTRPALGGNIMATIWTKNSTTQMATARPGVFKPRAADPSRRGESIDVPVALSESDRSWRLLQTEAAGAAADFHADIIVSGGKGVRSKPGYEAITGSLATALSKKFNTPVLKGASRAAVEHGFVDRASQVGQTGTAVSPNIYLALGISGAIQHMIGIAGSRTIFAVNSDPHAPIFKQCDYFLVGPVEQIVPELVQALQGAL